jgi:hypothetical protein
MNWSATAVGGGGVEIKPDGDKRVVMIGGDLWLNADQPKIEAFTLQTHIA